MSSETDAEAPEQERVRVRTRVRTRTRRRRHWKIARRVVGGVAALVVVLGGWTAYRALSAREHLMHARTLITALEEDVVSGDAGTQASLDKRVAAIQRETRAAKAATGDPVWALGAAFPIAGCPLRSAEDLANAADDLARTALPPLATAAGGLNPASLRHGESVKLAPLVAARVPLAGADGTLRRLTGRLDTVPSCGSLGRLTGIGSARNEFVTKTDRIAGQTAQASTAAALLPPMLGGGGIRRYLLVVQNDAEARASGGIIGGFGLLTAEHGNFHLSDISGNGKLDKTIQAHKIVAMGNEFDARYGTFQADHIWANANLTPDYPSTSTIWAAMYRKATGIQVDGTLALDPTALSYVVSASSPAKLPDGSLVSGDKLVAAVESNVYARIGSVAARDDYFAAVGKAAYRSATHSGKSTALVTALGRAAGEGRLMVASRVPAEEALLRQTPLGGALPTTAGPFLAVVSQNATASKLDYWIRRQTTYAMTQSSDGSGDATITVRLTNLAPKGLPAYVTLRQDLPGRPANPRSRERLWVSVYTGVGSTLVGATLDGKVVGMSPGVEKGHPIVSRYLSLYGGESQTLVLRVHEPVGGPSVEVRRQPMVRPERITVTGISPRVLPGATD